MARFWYDLHLHSCLSPCGSDDMTPNNLVNMAALLGYDIIALTDHNTARNTPGAVLAGRKAGITVVPGMELTTTEEAHVVCLFPTPEKALEFEAYIREGWARYPNDAAIFGNQWILDGDDRKIGEEPDLLISATGVSINEVRVLAERFAGTAFPAHVDKNAYSVIASLGAIPPEAGFQAAEISFSGDPQRMKLLNPELEGLFLLRNSDAHYLESMRDPSQQIELEENTAECLIAKLGREVKDPEK